MQLYPLHTKRACVIAAVFHFAAAEAKDQTSIFWDTIEKLSGGPEDRVQMLEQIMSGWTMEQRRAFGLQFYAAHNAALNWDLWGAGYLLNGGMSDDTFIDFRGWLISQGQKVYAEALRNPDSLAEVATPYEVTNEDFLYVATDGVLATDRAEIKWPSEPSGSYWEEQDLSARLPNIFALVENAN